MSKLAALLGGMTLTDLAREILGSQGRRGDTELAHVNKREAALLKSRGGSGTVNPRTGMREFYDGMDYPMDMGIDYGTDALGGEFGNVGGGIPDVSYMAPEYGGQAIGQPPPQVGGGQSVSPLQENFDIGFGPGQFTPQYGAADVSGMGRADFGRAMQNIQPATPGIGERIRGAAKEFEDFNKAYPTTSRIAGAAVGGIPGLMASRRMGREAQQTRAEMERMAAPIRAQGEAQLSAGQRGELTASQQQQVQALRAAQAQARSRRGVTAGTAQAQDEARVAEFAQRLAQTNIDNGVRLIGAANTFSAQAIRDAYKMNADAATMTQNYFNNLMRAAGAIPAQTTQPTQPTQPTGTS